MFNWDVLVEVIEFLIFYGVYSMIFGGLIGENYVQIVVECVEFVQFIKDCINGCVLLVVGIGVMFIVDFVVFVIVVCEMNVDVIFLVLLFYVVLIDCENVLNVLVIDKVVNLFVMFYNYLYCIGIMMGEEFFDCVV